MSSDRAELPTKVDIEAIPGPRSGPLEPGDRVGQHVIIDAMASGGFATVYAAEHVLLRRKVAVKVLRNDLAQSPEMVERFIREARSVNMIRHPNIVDIHDIGSLPGGSPFYVMEHLDGRSLSQHVTEIGRLSPDEALPVLTAVGDALTAAHALGIIHRDIKPSNIFLSKGFRGEDVVKLLDFGIAKLLHREPGDVNLTTVDRRLGTPQYMAPEQLMGDPVSPATDIYGLAATVFHLLTGRPPFLAASLAEAERLHLQHAPFAPSRFAPVGGAIDAVLLKALAKKPSERYSTVNDFVAAFAAAVSKPTEPNLGKHCIAVFATAQSDGTPDAEFAALDFADAIEDCLRNRGFLISMRAGSSCLAAMPIPSEKTPAEVATLIEALKPALAVAVNCEASAFVKTGFATFENDCPSGPLLEYGAWVPSTLSHGVFISDDFDVETETLATSAHHQGFRRA